MRLPASTARRDEFLLGHCIGQRLHPANAPGTLHVGVRVQVVDGHDLPLMLRLDLRDKPTWTAEVRHLNSPLSPRRLVPARSFSVHSQYTHLRGDAGHRRLLLL